MMNDFHYERLSASLNEALAIHRGEKEPSRVFHVERPNVKNIRDKTGLSQIEFANKLHISPRKALDWLTPLEKFAQLVDYHKAFETVAPHV